MKQHIEVWNELDKTPLSIVEVLICREFYAIAGVNNRVYCKTDLLMKRTGRSKDVIYRAIRGLEKKAWIEQVVGKFSHVRTWKLMHFELATSQQAVDYKSTESQLQSDYKSTLYIGSKRGIKIKEEKNLPDGQISKRKLEKIVQKKLEEKLKEEVKEMFYKKKEMPNPYMNLNAEEISKLKIKMEPPVKKIHAGTLCSVWELSHAEFYPDIFIGQSTMAERGMFKHFLKFATPEHALAALYFAVKYWISFVKFCQKNGAVGNPSTPKLKYLLKYVKQSVTFYISKQNTITGVYAKPQIIEGLGLNQPLPEDKIPEVKGEKESGSEFVSDVPMNSEEANELYKKLFQKGNK